MYTYRRYGDLAEVVRGQVEKMDPDRLCSTISFLSIGSRLTCNLKINIIVEDHG